MSLPDKLLEWIKLTPKYLACLLVLSLLLMFLPNNLLVFLGIKELRDIYRSWIGLTIIVTVSFLCVHGCIPLVNQAKVKCSERRKIKLGRKKLHDLTPEEKHILSKYLYENTLTQYFEVSDGIVSGLEQSSILYRSSDWSHRLYNFAYNIQPWAWKYLNKHKELVHISKEGRVKDINSFWN